MRRLQTEAAIHSAIGCTAAIVLTLLASHGSALAQNAPAPANCDLAVMPSVTDAAVTPKRRWQMVGQPIDLMIASSNLTANAKPLVCFRWKLKEGTGQFVQAESVRIVERTQGTLQAPTTPQPPATTPPTTQRPPTIQQPSTLTVRVPVPLIDPWPTKLVGEYTEDDPASPFAEVRILLSDADGKVFDVVTTTFAVVGPNPFGGADYCNVPRAGRTDVGTVTTSKNWQPVHGEIEVAAESFKPLPSDLTIRVCFRWKVKDSDKTDPFSDSETNRILDRQAGSNKVRLAVTVPDIGNVPDRFWGKSERIGDFGILGVLLPKVDVRVLFFDTNLEVVLDAWTHASVTSIFFGVAAAVLAVLGGFLALWWICRRPFTTFGKTTNPILCLVTTRRGVASLSQFQIMLWTFLVIASVAYVLALSGTLIPITTGTLVLLGISGGAAIIAKVKSESDATAALPRLDTATAAVEAERANDEAKKARAAADETPGDGEARSTVEEAEAKATAAKAKAEAVEAAVAAAKARTAVATAATDADKANAEAAARQAETEAETKRKAADEAAAKAAVITRVRRPRWSDLVMEEIKGRELDVTRVQMLYFTLLTASFVGVKVATSWEIPDIPEGYLILMGISNGVYVGSKLATKPGG